MAAFFNQKLSINLIKNVLFVANRLGVSGLTHFSCENHTVMEFKINNLVYLVRVCKPRIQV